MKNAAISYHPYACGKLAGTAKRGIGPTYHSLKISSEKIDLIIYLK